MLNILWPILIIISFTYGILNGKADAINESVFRGASDAVQLSINLLRNDVPMERNNANSIKNKSYEKNYEIATSYYEVFISGNKRN